MKKDFSFHFSLWLKQFEKRTFRVALIKLGYKQENLSNFNKIDTAHRGVPEEHMSQFS